ncbi:hypothetical protein Lal_00036781 [Lupinus albus]|nr:hypothetical protein Lal_00036781 [Lupinus albus]
MTFIDLVTAYDKVLREFLWNVVEKKCVRIAYIRAINDMYDGIRTSIRTQDEVSKDLPIAIGLHQGSTLSAHLFKLVLDVLTEHIQEPMPQCTLFSNDIVCLSGRLARGIKCEVRNVETSFRSTWISYKSKHILGARTPEIADALYYNAAQTLCILQKFGLASRIFGLWFHLLQQVKKSGVRVNFKREHEMKVCCLGLTSLLALSADQLPGETLGRVFRATLDLLVSYKDLVAVAAKEEEADDDMDGSQSDDEYECSKGSDKEMGGDAEDGDVADTITLRKLAEQVKSFRPTDEDDDDSDDCYSDDEELQSPLDEVDPFVFFVDTIKDPLRTENLTRTLELNYQTLAIGVAQHAEQRRAKIEKEKLEMASTVTAS